jgi:hypothetical protein
MGNTHSGKPRNSLEKHGFPGIPGKFSSVILEATVLTFSVAERQGTSNRITNLLFSVLEE